MDTTSHVFKKGYFNETLVDPFTCIILVMMCILILAVNRKYAVWPMIIIACFVAQAQRFSPGGVDFVFLRVITIFGVIRILLRGEFVGFKLNACDVSVLAFMGIRLLWSILKITKATQATPLTLCGDTLDMWGMYFFFRCVVRDFDDLKSATNGFILVSIPVAILFVVEHQTLLNPFAFQLAADAKGVTRSREGTLRCMGAYSHPILAGCFWASLLPYMGAMIKQRGRIKIMPLIGIACASLIIILSGSSSPIAAAGLAFLGGCAFLFRKRMRLIRWVTFLTVLTAQLAANSPIWKVFARVKIVGGSTGYYRFLLIDQFIKHFPEWWLAGSARGTSTWKIPMFDIVNYYVSLGLAGGLIFVALLVFILVSAYRSAGKSIRSAAGNVEWELLAWSTGVAVFTHMMSFLAVAYYGQIIMVWFFALAVTSIRSSSPVSQRGFSVKMGGYTADSLSRMAARPVLPYQQRQQPMIRR